MHLTNPRGGGKPILLPLMPSNDRGQLALEASGDCLWDWNLVTGEVHFSPPYEAMLGYQPGELEHLELEVWLESLHPEDRDRVFEALTQHFNNPSYPYRVEYRCKTKQGEWWWLGTFGKVIERDADGSPLRMVGIHRDLNDKNQAEQKLKEKEMRLQEIHHRVKNNLSMVSSLLKMQARRTQDRVAADILKDSQNRIASIALVHEKLYRSDDFARVDLRQYVVDLTAYLFDSYNVAGLELDIRVDQGMELGIETAVPIGLIVNELASNALKYAFPDQTAGKISICFTETEDSLFVLTIEDDGIGLPADLSERKTKASGLTLVEGLTHQLKGRLNYCNRKSKGARFEITFDRAEYTSFFA